MIRIELPTLISKLNPQAKYALEQAASLCMSRHNAEVTFEHLLLACLEMPLCDVRTLLKKADLDHQQIHQQVLQSLTRDESLTNYPAFSPLLVELLQDAWLVGSMDFSHQELRTGIIFLAALMRTDRYMYPSIIPLFESINRETLRKHFAEFVADSSETPVAASGTNKAPSMTQQNEMSAVSRFCRNFSEMARAGELDPVLCRDDEINLMIDILCRRRKNNPIVVGDAGVGKSAVVEGLALRIAAGQVPESLQNVDVMGLDLGLLQAGASVKGEFEKRLKAIIEEIKHAASPIILFIDEAHTLIGAGNQEGGGDAANLLKPALARGELRTVAATTWKEYKKYFEKDAALSRRFQLVKLDAPSAEQTVDILRGLQSVYENAHQVLISDDALKAASLLSDRYVSGRQLPDKAIDVLDTACARVAINLTSPPRQLAALAVNQHQRTLEIQALTRQYQLGLEVDLQRIETLKQAQQTDQEAADFLSAEWEKQGELTKTIIEKRHQILALYSEQQATEQAQQMLQQADVAQPLTEESFEAHLNTDNDDIADQLAAEGLTVEQQCEMLRNELTALYQQLAELQKDCRLINPEVNSQQIAQVIADWTGVPIDQMDNDELQRITQLPTLLEKEIKGQHVAISRIHQHLLTARADLRRPGRPKGAFLLVGPSGVGKTETVLQIAEQLYGGKQFLTTINMSEYQEKHTVSRLIGSPPGYVGYGEGGILTEAIRKMPYSIVLLDEVEKAHPEVLNLFYQAFDKGELADGEGRLIDCQNIVFFLTSNLGFQTIVDYAETPNLLEEKLYPELAAFFKPALLARMEIVPYLPLNNEVLAQIVRGKLRRLEKLFKQRYQAEVTIEDNLIEEILRRATRAENGARMLEAIIDGQLLPPVSLALLNKLAANEPVNKIRLYVNDGQLSSEVE